MIRTLDRSVSPPPVSWDQAYPSSRKVFVEGPGGVGVPMREIALSGGEEPFRVYDTSGPQGGDVREGLPRLREPWVAARDVVETGRVAALRPGRKDDAPEVPAGLRRTTRREGVP